MFTITTLADTATTQLDIDRDAAQDAAREYISQLEKLENRTIDEDDLTEDDYEFILESIRQSQPEVTALPLDYVADTRDRLEAAREEHHKAIIAAKEAGASVMDITRASAYKTRQSIYDVIKK